jgi:hypothetical protein
VKNLERASRAVAWHVARTVDANRAALSRQKYLFIRIAMAGRELARCRGFT